MYLQHTFIRIGGLATARRSKEDTEWCQFTNAQHNHRKNSSSGGAGQMADIRPGRMDPSHEPDACNGWVISFVWGKNEK